MAIKGGDIVWEVRARVKKFAADLKDADTKAGKFSKSLVKNSRAIGVGMTAAGVGIVAGLGAVVKTAATFEQAIANAASVTGLAGEELKQTKERLSELALELGGSTVFSATEAAEAFRALGSLGLKVARMEASELKPILDLAIAGTGELADTSRIAVGTMKSFSLETSELARISDVFAFAIGNSGVELEKLRLAMPQVGAIASELGLTLEEVVATLATLFEKDIRAETAATGIRNILLNFQDIKGPLLEVLEELGVGIEEIDLKTNGLTGTWEMLTARGLTAEQSMRAFGKESAAVAAVLSQDVDWTKAFIEALDEASGTADAMAKGQLDTLKGQLKLLSSAFEAVAIPIGQALIPAIRAVAEFIAPLLQRMANWAKEHPKLTNAIVGTVAIIGGLLFVLGPLLIILPGLVAAFGFVAAGAAALGIPVLALAGIIGVVVAAVAGAAIAILIWWDEIKAGLNSLGERWVNMWNMLPGVMKTALKIMTAPMRIFFDFVKTGLVTIRDFVQALFGLREFGDIGIDLGARQAAQQQGIQQQGQRQTAAGSAAGGSASLTAPQITINIDNLNANDQAQVESVSQTLAESITSGLQGIGFAT